MELNQDVILTFISIILPLVAAAFIALLRHFMPDKDEHLREFYATALVTMALLLAFCAWNVISLLRTKKADVEPGPTIEKADIDFLQANVNGKAETFILKRASISYGNIQAEFASYNPRGEVMRTVLLSFDKDIEPGFYSSENGDLDFKIYCGNLSAQSSLYQTIFNSRREVIQGAGNFTLNLTFRSDDWKTYAGTFQATLGRTEFSGHYGDSSMTIEDATFQFTLADD